MWKILPSSLKRKESHFCLHQLGNSQGLLAFESQFFPVGVAPRLGYFGSVPCKILTTQKSHFNASQHLPRLYTVLSDLLIDDFTPVSFIIFVPRLFSKKKKKQRNTQFDCFCFIHVFSAKHINSKKKAYVAEKIANGRWEWSVPFPVNNFKNNNPETEDVGSRWEYAM